jgi:hypothetical protein
VPAHPTLVFVLFVAALWRQVEIVVGADQQITAACVGRIGVEDATAFVFEDHGDARRFAFMRLSTGCGFSRQVSSR